MPSSNARALGAAAAVRAAALPGSDVQSGWPGIGGVSSPYTHAVRNGSRSRPAISDASRMKSAVDATPYR